MKLKDLTPEMAKWIETNEVIFRVNHRMTDEQLTTLYTIYNYVY